ncbi:MAG: hypothetical protein WC975_12180 [Phycisphaerae bacterium]
MIEQLVMEVDWDGKPKLVYLALTNNSGGTSNRTRYFPVWHNYSNNVMAGEGQFVYEPITR